MLNTDQTITLMYALAFFSIAYSITRIIIKWRAGKEFPLSEALIVFWVLITLVYINSFINSNL